MTAGRIVVAIAVALVSAPAQGQAPAPASAVQIDVSKYRNRGMLPGDLDRMAIWRKLPDITGSGPFPADYAQPAGKPFVVYQPKDLASASSKKKLGVYLWGTGGCVFDGASARFHLSEIASHGFVAISPGLIRSGPKAPPATEPTVGAVPSGPSATTEAMLAALDWILAENARPGSPYHERIDPRRIAAGGNSCGGLLALKAGLDPRVSALAVQNSGVSPRARWE